MLCPLCNCCDRGSHTLGKFCDTGLDRSNERQVNVRPKEQLVLLALVCTNDDARQRGSGCIVLWSNLPAFDGMLNAGFACYSLPGCTAVFYYFGFVRRQCLVVHKP